MVASLSLAGRWAYSADGENLIGDLLSATAGHHVDEGYDRERSFHNEQHSSKRVDAIASLPRRRFDTPIPRRRLDGPPINAQQAFRAAPVHVRHHRIAAGPA
jgi:hypothetical protein